MVGSDTKKVVKAASDGNLEEYKKAIGSYSWPRTRDYTMVLLIFSPIIAAISTINQMGVSYESSDTVKQFQDLAPLVDSILTDQKTLTLCKSIGEGYGKGIKRILNSFTEYKELLKKLSGDKYGGGGTSDKFMERAGNISEWVTNGNYIKTYLVPFVREYLGSKFAAGITKGLKCWSDMRSQDVSTDFTEYPSGDYLTFEDLIISGNSEVQKLSSAERKRILERGWGVHKGNYWKNLPSRIKVTTEMRDFFNRFGETLEEKILYITENQLYSKLHEITDTKVSTYNDLESVSKIFEKYVKLYKSAGIDQLDYLDGQGAKRLYMKCVMDCIPNYNKPENIDFERFEKTIELIRDFDPNILKEANEIYKKLFDRSSWYYSSIIKQKPQPKTPEKIMRLIDENDDLSSYYKSIIKNKLEQKPYKNSKSSRRNSIS